MFWSPSRLIIEFSVRPRLRKMDRSYLTDDLSIISCRGDNLLWELRKNLVAGCWNKFIFLILTSTSFVRHCLNRAAVIKALEKKATDTNWKFSEFLLDQMRELINCFHEGHKVSD